MRSRYIVALAALGGMALGAGAAQIVHAQAQPPVYMIAMNDVSNPEGYRKDYLPVAQKSIKEHGGIYVAAGPGTVIDGTFPKGRVVVLRWESMEALKGWRNSPEYVAARKIGEAYAQYNVIAVTGVKQ